MNEAERRRVAEQALKARREVDRNKRLIDAVGSGFAGNPASFDLLKQAIDQVSRMIKSLGSFENLASSLKPIFDALGDFYDALPPNWSGELTFEQAIDLTSAGLPVVWVPPSAILAELGAAADRPARMAVLQSHRNDLHEDVLRVLDEVASQELTAQVSLAKRSNEAWAAGHHEAAQALAVVVAENVVTKYFAEERGYRSYEKVREAAALGLDAIEDMPIPDMRFLFAMAPVRSFYTPWFPNKGMPEPEALSRHMSVHNPTIEHYSEDNALIAVLLQTSLLRAFHDVLDQRQQRSNPVPGP